MTASKDKAGNIFARQNTNGDFPENATSANPVYFRTYSRFDFGTREQWGDTCARTVDGIAELGQLTDEEKALLYRNMRSQKCLPSGRWMWIGGTEWIKKPENYYGAFNCMSAPLHNWSRFALKMNLAMQGCGTGSVVEKSVINQLPKILNKLNVKVIGDPGLVSKEKRQENTTINVDGNSRYILVGDSRKGWVDSYLALLELSSDDKISPELDITIDVSNVRAKGERLKGFGGIANPIKLKELYPRVAEILNGALGRKLNSLECTLIVDEALKVVVAGNVRRCLPEDALVHTNKGLIPIKDVNIGDMVQTPIGFRKVTNKFDQGIQDVYELETNATTPRATLNHRVAVVKSAFGAYEWKEIQNLQEGDRLLHNHKILPGANTHLPNDFTQVRPDQSRTAKNIVIPELTTDVAWLIGFTHGNGYVSLGRNKHDKPYGSISWSSNSLYGDLLERIQEKIDKGLRQFGVTAKHTTIVNENTAVSRCSSIRLAEYFYQYIKKPNTPLEVPSFILQGSSDIRAAYLAGLMDSDGAINNRPPHLVTSVYPDFIRQVGCVLSSLGIAGRIKSTRAQKSSWKTRHHVTIPALKGIYNSIIALHSAKGELKQGLKMNGFTIPNTIMRQDYLSTELMKMGFNGSITATANYERYIAESDFDLDIPVTFNNTGSYDSVQTYDIEVEEAHCFYCDGYLTHNSAAIKQGSSNDTKFTTAKDGLWIQNESGQWVIDPKRDALRMSNHTRVFHHKPTKDECINAVQKQYYSGEGAIQWAGESVARCNADLLETEEEKRYFLSCYHYARENAENYLLDLLIKKQGRFSTQEIQHRINRYGGNPCFEIQGTSFMCNLSEIHLNQIDPLDFKAQEEAFKAGALWVAPLLTYYFDDKELQQSRELDPIVGVGFTGLFDFFVNAFGVDWLRWWEAGRPDFWIGWNDGLEYQAFYTMPKEMRKEVVKYFGKVYNSTDNLAKFYRHQEQQYLERWSKIVHDTVWEYCDRHNLKRPNRCTTVKPSGSQSLLTGASPGWHPPKAAYFIRRVTYAKNDPVALACVEFGYNITPSQSDKDENGVLLNDPYDPRCTEWLVEIPTKTNWADLDGVENIDISQFSALAQFDFYMQVQKHYATHNVSATLELREHEIEALGERIYQAIQNDEGYISAALLARFDDFETFPRMPFHPISREQYNKLNAEVLARRKTNNFKDALAKYDTGLDMEVVLVACDGGKCELKQN